MLEFPSSQYIKRCHTTHFDADEKKDLCREWKLRHHSSENASNGAEDTVDNDCRDDHVLHDFLLLHKKDKHHAV